MSNELENKEQEGNIEIKVSKVLEMLNNGKTREDIGKHYSLSKSEIAQVFKHPKLKGKKTVKPNRFLVLDDTAEEIIEKSVTEEVEN